MGYYMGNVAQLEADLKEIEGIEETNVLNDFGQAIGYGRCQQILQVIDIDPTVVFPERISGPLKEIGLRLGSVKCQKILQILWAKFLNERGDSMMGALGPD